MTDDPRNLTTNLPPGRYGKVLVLPQAEIGNPTDEELTWPIAKAKLSSEIRSIDNPHENGSVTEKELT
jgi:hypothetical protein